MKTLLTRLTLLAAPALLAAAEPAASLEEALRQSAADYAVRIERAAAEVAATRERIAAEKAPHLDAARQLQDSVLSLQNEVARLEAAQGSLKEDRSRLQQELDGLRRNLHFLSTEGLEGLKGLQEVLLPAEEPIWHDRLSALQARYEEPSRPADAAAGLDALQLALDRTNRALGGDTFDGSSIIAGDNRLVPGRFVFLGPEVFFRSADGAVAGVVRKRDGDAAIAITHAIKAWKPEAAAPLFAGTDGPYPADPSLGKALPLRVTRGTVIDHIHTGGLIAYLILVAGAISLTITTLKLIDARQLRVETPERTRDLLRLLAAGRADEARRALAGIAPTTRELFAAGLDNLGKTSDVLEEHLRALLQHQRLHFERRLPLLAVIATAAPLMGLLGTVMGMVKTFALITVFGTGNAAKLSSGISEVLVATELGLAVAIPTLVVHGFLSHRIQKGLALLEQQAWEFVAAAGEAKPPRPPA